MSSTDDIYRLPPDLPAPVDDGACDHLVDMGVPKISLPATSGRTVALSDEPGTAVVFAYPRTGPAGQDPPAGWNEIPGARGCTPEACGFRDEYVRFRALGATVYGLSTQTTAYQHEMAERLHLPYEVLSDVDFRFTQALRLPTFTFEGVTLLKRLTLVVQSGVIRHVFYPVFPTDTHAEEVVEWLGRQPDFHAHSPQAPQQG